MLRIAVLALLAAAPLFAQTDPLGSIGEGDRVELTLKNGTVFRGEVVWIAEGQIKIDISFESPDTDGSISLPTSQIARATRLEKLTREQKDQLLREKEENHKRRLAELAAREAKEAGTAETPESKEGLSAKELLKRFPFPDWSDDRRKELMKKDAKQLTDEEKDFLDQYAEWKKARDKQERDELVEKFSPGNGWDKKRFADLLSRRPETWTDEERQFVQIYDQLAKARDEKAADDRSTLLDEFPPGKEWNEEKDIQLKTQFVRIHVPLTQKEQKFVDHYDDWVKAIKEKEEKDLEKEEIKKELKGEADKEGGGNAPQNPPK